MKLVVNRCYGGFGLSLEAKLLYLKKAGYPNAQVYKGVPNRAIKVAKEDYPKFYGKEFDCYVTYEDYGDNADIRSGRKVFCDFLLERNDSILIEVIEELGYKANNLFSELEIVEIPDDINYEITDYDGYETVEEFHRSW